VVSFLRSRSVSLGRENDDEIASDSERGRRAISRNEVKDGDVFDLLVDALDETKRNLLRSREELFVAVEIPFRNGFAVEMGDEIAEFDLCRVGRRAGHDSGDAPVSGGFVETYACAATGWSDDGVVGVAMKINAIAFLVEGDGEVFENLAAEGRELVGEVDDGAGEAVVANGECFGEAADLLGSFARERADGGARAGS
jgi:hypothetical protein